MLTVYMYEFKGKFTSNRGEMEKVQYMYGLMVLEESMMIVPLMVMHQVYTQSLLELLVLMVIPVCLMRSVLQKWLQHM